MKLIVQPEAGLVPIVTAIKQARKTVDLLIFRLDRSEVARALEMAVARGVHVRALTAHQNRGGTRDIFCADWAMTDGGRKEIKKAEKEEKLGLKPASQPAEAAERARRSS